MGTYILKRLLLIIPTLLIILLINFVVIQIAPGGPVEQAIQQAEVRQGYRVDLIEQREEVALETSFANGGQLSYRYVSPLADAGVPLQALSWMLQGNAPLRFRPSLSPHQWQCCLRFLLACRRSVNQRNGAHLLRLALYSQSVLQGWRELAIMSIHY